MKTIVVLLLIVFSATLAQQTAQRTVPEHYQPKQYLCALRLKPKEKRVLTLWTPYAPVKVLEVDARPEALKEGGLVINRIEYADGSVWKKSGWNIQLPPGSSQRLSDGKCSVF